MALANIVSRTLKIGGVALVLLIAAAVAIPYFFKDKILVKVKETINKDLNAKVDFKDVNLSVFKHFPKISVSLLGLDVEGVDDFEGVKLIHTEGLDLALNFWSVWNGGNPYEVNSVPVDRPVINVIALANGKANYSITKPKPPSAPTAFKLQAIQAWLELRGKCKTTEPLFCTLDRATKGHRLGG